MKFADDYLAKHGPGNHFLNIPPERDLKYIAVIPAFNESGLVECLDSLFQCVSPTAPLEVITVINWPFGSDQETINRNIQIREEAELWARDYNCIGSNFQFITAEPLDEKRSGVGFARKTGMDEAVFRLWKSGQDEGIIISLDADVKVKKNYFSELEKHFNRYPRIDGCTVYFEHPYEEEKEGSIKEAIIQYEIHQRYYVQALRYAGHPNAFHTVGSAFAIRLKSYCLQGGMNLRKAGEDFYFLQKLFDLGNFSECNSTCVYPSPRPSDRVGFGTGSVVASYMKNRRELTTFNPELFDILKEFLMNIQDIYEPVLRKELNFLSHLHPLLQNFLEMNDIQAKLTEIADNSSGNQAFVKRFFRWFNMFRVLKFLNFAKKNIPDIGVSDAAVKLLSRSIKRDVNLSEPEEILYHLRTRDREGEY